MYLQALLEHGLPRSGVVEHLWTHLGARIPQLQKIPTLSKVIKEVCQVGLDVQDRFRMSQVSFLKEIGLLHLPLNRLRVIRSLLSENASVICLSS